MISVKILLRKVATKNGSYPIIMRVIKDRKTKLFDINKLKMITEHSDPRVLEFAAGEILNSTEYEAFMKLFVTVMLRYKDKYRKIKELIKMKSVNKDILDVETLIELAQSNNKSDSNWA